MGWSRRYAGAPLMGIAVGNGCTGNQIGVCGGERDKYDAEYLIRTGLVRALYIGRRVRSC